MKSRQGHSIVVERRVIRADGVPRPGDENQVVAVWDENGDAERAVRGSGDAVLIDRTGYTKLAEHVHTAQPTDAYLERMERLRWEQERKQNR